MKRIEDLYWEASETELWQMYRSGITDAAITLIARGAHTACTREANLWADRLARQPELRLEGI
jgi:hypothetical protein